MQRRVLLTTILSLLTTAPCLAQSSTTKPTTMPSLDEQVRTLKAAGEPVTPAELKTWPTLPDERNAAKVVWGLRDRMRRPTPDGGGWGNALSTKTVGDHRLPLPLEDADDIRKALLPQLDVLTLMDQIPELHGFDWGPPPASPYAVERSDFPEGAYWGTCRHQLYLDGLLAIHERDAKRAWRRVEILRRLGEGMATYPGHHDMAPQWPYLRGLSARLAADAASSGVVAPEDRDRLHKLIDYWLDDTPVRNAMILHCQRERVAVIDALVQLTEQRITSKQLAAWYREVNGLQERRIGVPMWPTVVWFYTGEIGVLRKARSFSRTDLMAENERFRDTFMHGGFVPMHVLNQFGTWYEQWHVSLCQLRATQQLAAAAIAVQLYRIDHEGRLPGTLDDLVPKYLPAVPTDSGAKTTAPMRYRADEDGGATLWTTGKDGTDEGGKPPPPGVSRGDYRVKMDDVVRFERKPQ